jgi:hypothetical protein
MHLIGLGEENMAKLNRSPLQVSLEFKKKLDEIQRKIRMAQGENRSLREITDDIVKSPMFIDIEKSLIKSGNIKMDIKVRFDRRMLE